ncbi:hypothetical protein ACWC98_26465 [Streptomyces goshikiensis]
MPGQSSWRIFQSDNGRLSAQLAQARREGRALYVAAEKDTLRQQLTACGR